MNVLDTHASRVIPELRDLEMRLQFTLEGIGGTCCVNKSSHAKTNIHSEEKILLRFTQIDPLEPQKEYSVVIDASERLYKGMGNPFSITKMLY